MSLISLVNVKEVREMSIYVHSFLSFARMSDIVFAGAGFFLFVYLLIFLSMRKLKSVWSWPLLIVSVTWLLLGVWEMYCATQGYNIRIDAFIIYPALIVISFLGLSVSVGSMLISLFKQRH